MSDGYFPVGPQIAATAAPRIDDLFRILHRQPDYRDEDTPFVLKYEAYGGAQAPPGALTLAQHDVVHFLAGVGFVPYGTGQKKDSERFLSGFQFGADPAFGKKHFADFVRNVEAFAPEEYKFGSRGYRCFLQGVTLGRAWHLATGIDLRRFAQNAIDHNAYLDDLFHGFWPGETNAARKKIRRTLNQTRDGIPESFDPAEYVWPDTRNKPYRPMTSADERRLSRYTGNPGIYEKREAPAAPML